MTEYVPVTEEIKLHDVLEYRLRQAFGYCVKGRPPRAGAEAQRAVEKCVEFVKSVKPGGTTLLIGYEIDPGSRAKGFGARADCLIAGKGSLHVIDFDFTSDRQLSVRQQPSIELYARAAADVFLRGRGESTVRVTLYQPVFNSISSAEFSAKKPIERL